jgi:hypothetical protein
MRRVEGQRAEKPHVSKSARRGAPFRFAVLCARDARTQIWGEAATKVAGGMRRVERQRAEKPTSRKARDAGHPSGLRYCAHVLRVQQIGGEAATKVAEGYEAGGETESRKAPRLEKRETRGTLPVCGTVRTCCAYTDLGERQRPKSRGVMRRVERQIAEKPHVSKSARRGAPFPFRYCAHVLRVDVGPAPA